MINNYWRSFWCFDGGWDTTIKKTECPPSTIISIPLGRCWQQDKSYWSMLRSPLPWKWCWPDNFIWMWDSLRFVFFDSHLCRVLVLWAVDVLGADVVFVHVAHHLLPLRLSQADAQRAECVKDDLNWGSVNLIKQYIYIYLIKEKNQNEKFAWQNTRWTVVGLVNCSEGEKTSFRIWKIQAWQLISSCSKDTLSFHGTLL